MTTTLYIIAYAVLGTLVAIIAYRVAIKPTTPDPNRARLAAVLAGMFWPVFLVGWFLKELFFATDDDRT